MKIIITQHNLGLWAAEHIRSRQQTLAKDPFVLGLPTGGTVEDMYSALSKLCENGKMSFQKVITFNMDEYVGLPPTHDQSYHYYMHHHLFSHVDAPAQNIHILNGMAEDLSAECENYEKAIAQAGGIDLFLGGVGRNGHIAFNEPLSDFSSKTRLVELTQNTKEANARFFNNDLNAVPSQALTVGIGTVLAAKELLFLASGSSKAQAVAQLATGKIDPQWPITALKTHQNAILLIDEEAASQLPEDILAQWKSIKKNNSADDLVLNI